MAKTITIKTDKIKDFFTNPKNIKIISFALIGIGILIIITGIILL